MDITALQHRTTTNNIDNSEHFNKPTPMNNTLQNYNKE